MLRRQFIVVATLLASSCFQASFAETNKPLPSGVAATVNGVEISDTAFYQLLKAQNAANRADTYELRTSIKDELINREVLAQEAVKQGLDKTPQGKVALEQARNLALVELLFNHANTAEPVTDKEVQDEYNRQAQILGSGEGLVQYRLSIIALNNAAEAEKVLARLKKGESFEALAKAHSIDPTKEQGGDVGWVLPSQISPLVANVMVNLAKGALPVAPIKMADNLFQIIRYEDKRPYKVPSFEESKILVRNGLIQAKRQALIQKLRTSATINQ
ncbi:MAG: hypothetical protein EBR59_07315 [Methylococcaceae bacterium]|nr:hypothetical protein [Methylococcaceae bacterium]